MSSLFGAIFQTLKKDGLGMAKDTLGRSLVKLWNKVYQNHAFTDHSVLRRLVPDEFLSGVLDY